MDVLVIVEELESNFAAYSPDVPGCVTTGSTEEETLRNMREALALHLEGEPPLKVTSRRGARAEILHV